MPSSCLLLTSAGQAFAVQECRSDALLDRIAKVMSVRRCHRLALLRTCLGALSFPIAARLPRAERRDR